MITRHKLTEGTSVATARLTVWSGTAAAGAGMRADHQVAQRLYAFSEPGSERVRDLVDLQLLDRGEDLDLPQVKTTCIRLFEKRRLQDWPPAVEADAGCATLYRAAVEDIDVLPDVDAAVMVKSRGVV